MQILFAIITLSNKQGDIMKNIVLSAVAIVAMSSFSVAGGDIAPVVEPVIDVPVVMTDSGFYVGVAYGLVDGTFNALVGAIGSDNEVKSTHNTLGLLAGYKVNSYVAVEDRYNMSLSEGTWSDNGTDVALTDTDDKVAAWGVFVKPMYPVTDALDIYALLGYGETTFTTGTVGNNPLVGASLDIVATGFQYGAGLSYDVTDSVAVFVDYVSLYNADAVEYAGTEVTRDVTIASINAGVSYKF